MEVTVSKVYAFHRCSSTIPSATIKIFLVNGDPKRLRAAELSNLTGKAVAGPRSEFDGLISREEADGSGIYFLTGSDAETGKPSLYGKLNAFAID